MNTKYDCKDWRGDPLEDETIKKVDSNISSKDGLLWRDGKIIELPEADRVAREHDFNCAEEFVRHLCDC